MAAEDRVRYSPTVDRLLRRAKEMAPGTVLIAQILLRLVHETYINEASVQEIATAGDTSNGHRHQKLHTTTTDVMGSNSTSSISRLSSRSSRKLRHHNDGDKIDTAVNAERSATSISVPIKQ